MTAGRGVFGMSERWWNFNGQIGDVRVYNRLLSADEIASLEAAR